MDISTYFRDDNTDGYSDTQLGELNARLAISVRGTDVDDDPIALDALSAGAERILTDYDTECATGSVEHWASDPE